MCQKKKGKERNKKNNLALRFVYRESIDASACLARNSPCCEDAHQGTPQAVGTVQPLYFKLGSSHSLCPAAGGGSFSSAQTAACAVTAPSHREPEPPLRSSRRGRRHLCMPFLSAPFMTLPHGLLCKQLVVSVIKPLHIWGREGGGGQQTIVSCVERCSSALTAHARTTVRYGYLETSW